jgi:hypothetical protein
VWRVLVLVLALSLYAVALAILAWLGWHELL